MHESPALNTGTVEKESPGRLAIPQDHPVEILSLQEVQAKGADLADRDSLEVSFGRPLLVVAAGQDQAHSTAPGMVVQAAVRVRVDEPVQVGMPAEGTEEIIPF